MREEGARGVCRGLQREREAVADRCDERLLPSPWAGARKTLTPALSHREREKERTRHCGRGALCSGHFAEREKSADLLGEGRRGA